MSIRRIAPGLILITLASAVLLLSDWDSERDAPQPRIAILQYASSGLMDEGVRGIGDALAQAGYVDGERALIRRYNAEGDMPTANAIGTEIVGGDFDLVRRACARRRSRWWPAAPRRSGSAPTTRSRWRRTASSMRQRAAASRPSRS